MKKTARDRMEQFHKRPGKFGIHKTNDLSLQKINNTHSFTGKD